ncbi:hypothetical protein ABN763_14305 [Spongiivirga sp. MCCC 1A20706]|uniref:hypothetical protein n=1 Tax=Spongiivirga sp. MCCC 1A20706 TaxID=3160963 RepID=UPI003977DBCB
MKTLLNFRFLATVIFALIAIACNPEDGTDGMDGAPGIQGEQGPAGPQGEQGEPGEDGVDGQDGQDGEDGNAEVYYSDWIPADFQGSSSSVKFMNIDFPPELPSAFSIKNTHIILVYFTGFGDGNVYLLPVLNFRGAQFTAGFGSGSASVEDILIRAQALSGDLNEFQIDPARGNRFRYVIIPPTINVSGKGTYPNFYKMTYEEVMDYLKLDL